MSPISSPQSGATDDQLWREKASKSLMGATLAPASRSVYVGSPSTARATSTRERALSLTKIRDR